jgi:hypothetical protein
VTVTPLGSGVDGVLVAKQHRPAAERQQAVPGLVHPLCALSSRARRSRAARESGPSFGTGARFLFYLFDGGERWRAAPAAAALELGGRLR